MLFVEESRGLESINISDIHKKETNPFFVRSSKASSLTMHGYFVGKEQSGDLLEQRTGHGTALTVS